MESKNEQDKFLLDFNTVLTFSQNNVFLQGHNLRISNNDFNLTNYIFESYDFMEETENSTVN